MTSTTAETGCRNGYHVFDVIDATTAKTWNYKTRCRCGQFTIRLTSVGADAEHGTELGDEEPAPLNSGS